MSDRPLRAVAARGSAVTMLAQLLRAGLLLVSTIVLARLVAPADFGLVAMVLAVTGVAEIFRDFGLSMAALQAPGLTQAQKSNLFWINSAVGLVLSAVVFLLAWPLADFYDQPQLVSVVQALSPVYVLGGLSAQFRVSINRELRFVALALCDLLPPLLAFVVAVLLATQGAGLAALVVQQLATAVLTLVAVLCFGRWWPGLPTRTAGMRPLLSFGMSFAATQLLAYATRNVDSIAIGRVWGAGQLGQYDRAFQLAVAPVNQVNAPMSRVAVPVLARVRGDSVRYSTALAEAQLIACYVTASVLFLLAGVGPSLVQLLLGPGWELAGQVLVVLAIGGVFRAIQQIAYWMFMSSGRADSQLRLHLAGQPIIIGLLLLGLPWGPIGVAIGSSVGYAVFWIISLMWAGRVVSVDTRPLFRTSVRAIVTVGAPAGLAAWAASTFVDLGPLTDTALGVAAALGWYLIAWTVSPPVRRDIRTLARFISIALGRNR